MYRASHSPGAAKIEVERGVERRASTSAVDASTATELWLSTIASSGRSTPVAVEVRTSVPLALPVATREPQATRRVVSRAWTATGDEQVFPERPPERRVVRFLADSPLASVLPRQSALS
jgi:hypothetical protein